MNAINPITEIDRNVLRVLRPELDAALEAIGAKCGIELKIGHGSFSPTHFTFKLEGVISGEVDADGARFLANAFWHGIDKSWLGKQVSFGGSYFTLVGLKSGGKSFMLRDMNGKQFRAPVDSFKRNAKLVEERLAANLRDESNAPRHP